MADLNDIRRRLENAVARTPGWEAGPGSGDAIDAQQIHGEWRAPTWGCDSLQHFVEHLRAILADWPEEGDEYAGIQGNTPASRMFLAMASRIEAGESYASVLADYNLVDTREGDRLTEEERRRVSAWRKFIDRDHGVTEPDLAAALAIIDRMALRPEEKA